MRDAFLAPASSPKPAPAPVEEEEVAEVAEGAGAEDEYGDDGFEEEEEGERPEVRGGTSPLEPDVTRESAARSSGATVPPPPPLEEEEGGAADPDDGDQAASVVGSWGEARAEEAGDVTPREPAGDAPADGAGRGREEEPPTSVVPTPHGGGADPPVAVRPAAAPVAVRSSGDSLPPGPPAGAPASSLPPRPGAWASDPRASWPSAAPAQQGGQRAWRSSPVEDGLVRTATAALLRSLEAARVIPTTDELLRRSAWAPRAESPPPPPPPSTGVRSSIDRSMAGVGWRAADTGDRAGSGEEEEEEEEAPAGEERRGAARQSVKPPRLPSQRGGAASASRKPTSKPLSAALRRRKAAAGKRGRSEDDEAGPDAAELRRSLAAAEASVTRFRASADAAASEAAAARAAADEASGSARRMADSGAAARAELDRALARASAAEAESASLRHEVASLRHRCQMAESSSSAAWTRWQEEAESARQSRQAAGRPAQLSRGSDVRSSLPASSALVPLGQEEAEGSDGDDATGRRGAEDRAAAARRADRGSNGFGARADTGPPGDGVPVAMRSLLGAREALLSRVLDAIASARAGPAEAEAEAKEEAGEEAGSAVVRFGRQGPRGPTKQQRAALQAALGAAEEAMAEAEAARRTLERRAEGMPGGKQAAAPPGEGAPAAGAGGRAEQAGRLQEELRRDAAHRAAAETWAEERSDMRRRLVAAEERAREASAELRSQREAREAAELRLAGLSRPQLERDGSLAESLRREAAARAAEVEAEREATGRRVQWLNTALEAATKEAEAAKRDAGDAPGLRRRAEAAEAALAEAERSRDAARRAAGESSGEARRVAALISSAPLPPEVEDQVRMLQTQLEEARAATREAEEEGEARARRARAEAERKEEEAKARDGRTRHELAALRRRLRVRDQSSAVAEAEDEAADQWEDVVVSSSLQTEAAERHPPRAQPKPAVRCAAPRAEPEAKASPPGLDDDDAPARHAPTPPRAATAPAGPRQEEVDRLRREAEDARTQLRRAKTDAAAARRLCDQMADTVRLLADRRREDDAAPGDPVSALRAQLRTMALQMDARDAQLEAARRDLHASLAAGPTTAARAEPTGEWAAALRAKDEQLAELRRAVAALREQVLGVVRAKERAPVARRARGRA